MHARTHTHAYTHTHTSRPPPRTPPTPRSRPPSPAAALVHHPRRRLATCPPRRRRRFCLTPAAFADQLPRLCLCRGSGGRACGGGRGPAEKTARGTDCHFSEGRGTKGALAPFVGRRRRLRAALTATSPRGAARKARWRGTRARRVAEVAPRMRSALPLGLGPLLQANSIFNGAQKIRSPGWAYRRRTPGTWRMHIWANWREALCNYKSRYPAFMLTIFNLSSTIQQQVPAFLSMEITH